MEAASFGYTPAKKILEQLLPNKEVKYCEFCGSKLPSLADVCPVCKKILDNEEN